MTTSFFIYCVAVAIFGTATLSYFTLEALKLRVWVVATILGAGALAGMGSLIMSALVLLS